MSLLPSILIVDVKLIKADINVCTKTISEQEQQWGMTKCTKVACEQCKNVDINQIKMFQHGISCRSNVTLKMSSIWHATSK